MSYVPLNLYVTDRKLRLRFINLSKMTQLVRDEGGFWIKKFFDFRAQDLNH